MSILHKTPRLSAEHLKLAQQNRPLYNLIDGLCLWVSNNLRKDITITHLWRSKAEHDALYASTDLLKRPPFSPHMRWQAVDLRSHGFSKDELDGMAAWVNKTYPNPGGKPTMMVHAIAGGAMHVHIQYKI